MSKQNISLLTLTVVASAVLAAGRFASALGAVAAAAGNALGVTRSDAQIGDRTPVDVIGTAVVEAGGVIPAGSYIEVGATGKAVVRAAGIAVAVAAPGESAAADGDFLEVLLLPNGP